uniref:(northern house mosquito) hypothetical protein n=1 Tax=Culex pipiens TaxID=7175 RepID=A0A8D8KWA0_CULPI
MTKSSIRRCVRKNLAHLSQQNRGSIWREIRRNRVNSGRSRSTLTAASSTSNASSVPARARIGDRSLSTLKSSFQIFRMRRSFTRGKMLSKTSSRLVRSSPQQRSSSRLSSCSLVN